MGYYKDTGSLQSMASAEAILKKRMPEKVGILPVAELLFVAESMWVGEHDMNSIRSVARGDRHKAGGYTWEYVNPAPDKRDNRGRNQPTAKKVRCAETGNQFVSLSDAARAVGLRNGNSIRRAIDRGGTAGGYHWEYLDEKKR